MAKHRLPVFDGDGHIVENYAEIWQCFEGEYTGLQKHSTYDHFPTLDGWPRGLYMARRAERKYITTSADIWGEMLNDLGAEGTVLYPTLGLAHGLIQDKEWAATIANAYNNWLETFYTQRDERIHGVGLMAVQDPEAAAKEIRRCRDRERFVAMLLPSVTKLGRQYGDEFFWPIFEEAERQRLPLAVHGGPSLGTGHDNFDAFVKVRVLHHPVPLFMHLTDMIFNGVFDAFPNLRVAFLEGGCTWVPWIIDRMDHEFDGTFGERLRSSLKRRPSAYVVDSDQIWFGFELEEADLGHTIAKIGSDRLIYASDYPHETPPDDIVSELPEFIASPEIPDEIKGKMLYHNAKSFYHLT